MDTLALQTGLIGLFALGIAFFLLTCWQIIIWIFKGIIHIKRRIKHEPEPREQYLVSFVANDNEISNTIMGIRAKIKIDDVDKIREKLMRDHEFDRLTIISIAYLGRE